MNRLTVPFFRPDIGELEVNEVVETLRSGWLTSGKRVQLFEQKFAAAVGAPHAVALNSCTAALHLAVEALGLRVGQGVLVPTMTFAATAEVVRYLGAVPVLVDCDPVTGNMDLTNCELRIANCELGEQRSENRGQRSEVGSQRTEVRDQRSEVGDQRTEVRGRRSEVGGQRAEIRSQRSEGSEIVGIMPVHVGGMMMDIKAVQEFAVAHNLWVVEDAAHAFPAAHRTHRRDAENAEVAQRSEVGGQEAEGSRQKAESSRQKADVRGQRSEVGDQTTEVDANEWHHCGQMEDGERRVVCFSFYANKTITTGEGGMAVTGSAELAQRMRLMSLHGLSQDAWERYSGGSSWDYRIIAPGFKYNLTDIAAAIGIHQLARAEGMRREREKIAHCYLETFGDIEEIELPPEDPNRIHAWHLFPIRLRLERLKIDRNGFIEELKQLGVGCSVHWRPLHLHPYYQETFGWKPEDFPVATALWQRLISLPIFPGMRTDEIDYVMHTIREICRRHSVGCTGYREEFSNRPLVSCL